MHVNLKVKEKSEIVACANCDRHIATQRGSVLDFTL